MNTPIFPDASIKVEARMIAGQLQPQTIVWQQQTYTVMAIGRQWSAEDGAHLLLELHDQSRMEIRLGNNLTWRLLRHWPATTSV